MPEPTNRELMHLINDIQTDVKENLAQAKTTNGRVNALEKWQDRVLGGMAVISIIVVPILVYILNHWK